MLIRIFSYIKTCFCNLVTAGGRCVVLSLLLCIAILSNAQVKPDYYVSNAGNDSFPGTNIAFPKKTIAATAPALQKTSDANGIVRLGLKAGDIFEEGLTTTYPIEVNSYSAATGNEMVILNGTKTFDTGWLKTPGNSFTFSQAIRYDGFVGYGIGAIGEYSYMDVFEIDKELEKTAPFSARRILTYMPGITEVENNAGSFYTPVGNQNPMPVYIHPIDGSSPNNNSKYRYEVTVRDYGINSTYQPNNHFENLWVRGFGGGIGMLPGGDNSYYNKIIFGPGAGIHHLVARGGTINHSLFLPGARNTNAFALTFYDAEGLNRHCTVKNSIYLDIPTPLYMHTSGGTNWGAVEMDSIVGFADSVLQGPFMYTSNNDTVLLNNIYADGYLTGYNYGNAKYAAINNCAFKDVQYGIAYNTAYNAINSTVNNVFIKTKGNEFSSGILVQNNTFLTLQNSVFHIAANNTTAGNSVTGAFVFGLGAATTRINATGNIFVCDMTTNKSLLAAATNTDDGIATSKDSWDNNVYVLLKGNDIQWTVTNATTNGGNNVVGSFEEWQRQSGQDKHSLFFDLRNDPRGLKAIFEDPENGNYDLANTKEGSQVAALHAGMTDAITCFLKRPTYEQAAEMIRNNTSFSASVCRNPCTQNSIKVNASFGIDSLNTHQIQLKWTIAEQQNINKYVILRSAGNAAFTRIGSIPVTADSVYTFPENVQPGVEYRYRLMVVATSGNQCFSDIRTIKTTDNKPFSIYPNPTTGKITVSMNGYIGKADFKLINSKGQTVFVQEHATVNGQQILDITKQPKGFYWLQIATSKGILVQKCILQ